MNKCFLFFILPVIFLSVNILAEVNSPVVFAQKTGVPVVVDGMLDEPCWGKAVKITRFLDIYDNSRPASPQTYFQVVYDKSTLYFGITGDEPNMKEVIREAFPRDAWPRGTSIEIFLDTNSDRATYYQFATNLGGSVFDSYNTDTKWNGNWKVASKIFKDRWTIEVAVPFSDFGMESPATGSRWGLNLCRNREGGLQYSSSWAPVGGDFHNPGKFNTLVFGSAGDWMKKEVQDYRAFREKTLSFLQNQQPVEEKLEAKLRRSGSLMNRVERTKISDKTSIGRILPVYKQVQTINVLCQDIDDEIRVIKSLNRIKK